VPVDHHQILGAFLVDQVDHEAEAIQDLNANLKLITISPTATTAHAQNEYGITVELPAQSVSHEQGAAGAVSFDSGRFAFSIAQTASHEQDESGIQLELNVGTVAHQQPASGVVTGKVKKGLFSIAQTATHEQNESGVQLELGVDSVAHQQSALAATDFTLTKDLEISCTTVSSTEIEISLDVSTTGPYDLYRDGSLIASGLSESDFPYRDSGLSPGAQYCYTAEDGTGQASNETCCITPT